MSWKSTGNLLGWICRLPAWAGCWHLRHQAV